MSEELAALIRASAETGAAEAAREHPFTADGVGRYLRDIRRRRVVGGATVGATGLAVVAVAMLGITRPWVTEAPPVNGVPTSVVGTTSPSPSASPTPTPTPSSTATAAPTPGPTATPPPEPEPTHPPRTTPPTSSPSPNPSVTPVLPPAAPRITGHGAGGGSGESVLSWSEVPGATSYRVYRSAAPGGPFVPAAAFDVATGASTSEYAGTHEYIGIAPDGAGYTYVEVVDWAPVYLLVVASNEGGDGPASTVVCSGAQVPGGECPP